MGFVMGQKVVSIEDDPLDPETAQGVVLGLEFYDLGGIAWTPVQWEVENEPNIEPSEELKLAGVEKQLDFESEKKG